MASFKRIAEPKRHISLQPGMVAYACKPSIWTVGWGWGRIRIDHPWPSMKIHDSEFETSLEASRTHLKNMHKSKTTINVEKKLGFLVWTAFRASVDLNSVVYLYTAKSWVSPECHLCNVQRDSQGAPGEVEEPGPERRSGLMIAWWVWLVRASWSQYSKQHESQMKVIQFN